MRRLFQDNIQTSFKLGHGRERSAEQTSTEAAGARSSTQTDRGASVWHSVRHFALNLPQIAHNFRSSKQEIVKQSVLEVNDRNIYDLGTVGSNKRLTKNGPNDARMGTSGKNGALCETCGGTLNECNGHFGRVRLALPAFHIGYFVKIIEVLQDICKV